MIPVAPAFRHIREAEPLRLPSMHPFGCSGSRASLLSDSEPHS